MEGDAMSILEQLHLNDLSVEIKKSHDESMNLAKDTFVDPYSIGENHLPSSSNCDEQFQSLPPLSQTCKERIIFMEFQATDRQVEIYESQDAYLSTDSPVGSNDLITDLYSSDLHVLQLSDSKQEQDDISSIMELHNVDLQVDSSVTQCKNSKLNQALFNDLLKTDQAVDGVHSNEETDMIDPFSQQIMRQESIKSTAALKDANGMSDISSLLRVDLEMDRHNENEAMKCLQSLLDVDEEVRVSADGYRAESNSSKIVANDANEVIMNELYTGDVNIERVSSKQTPVDSVKSIMELYETDVKIDSCNTHIYENGHLLSLFNDLLQTDQHIDKVQRIFHASECVDPYTESAIRQVDTVSRAFVVDSDSMSDIAELLKIDKLVDGPQHLHYMQPIHFDENEEKTDTGLSLGGIYEILPNDIAELHAVDVEIDQSSKSISQKDHVLSAMELLDVDREIEAIKSGLNFAGEEHYRELWSVDQVVEGRSVDYSIPFTDLATEQTMRQYKLMDNIEGMEDVESLLNMDRTVDRPTRPRRLLSDASSGKSQESLSKKRSIFSAREKSNAALADVFERARSPLEETKMGIEPPKNIEKKNDVYSNSTPLPSPNRSKNKRSIFSNREKAAASTYGQYSY